MTIRIRMLSVSSAHVSKETSDWLNDQGEKNATSHRTREMADIHVGSHGYGWIVYCHDEHDDSYPSDLVKVLDFARNEKYCEYVNIDSDGEEYSALEKYEW